jgi:hypothetical protein
VKMKLATAALAVVVAMMLLMMCYSSSSLKQQQQALNVAEAEAVVEEGDGVEGVVAGIILLLLHVML